MSKAKAKPSSDTLRRTGSREIIGLGLLAFSVLLGLSLISYRPHDISVIQSPPNQPTANIIGLVGAWSAYLLFLALGLAAYVLPVVLAAQGILCLAGDDHVPGMKLGHKLGWMALLLLCAACLLELMHIPVSRLTEELNLAFSGGAVGHLLGTLVLIRLMGEIGTGILIAFLVLIASVCLFDFEIAPFFRDPKGTLGPMWAKLMLLLSPGSGDAEAEEEVEPPPRKPAKSRTRVSKPVPEPDPLAEPLFPEPETPLSWDEPEPQSVPEPPPPAPPVTPAPPAPVPAAEPDSIFKRSAKAKPKASDPVDPAEILEADVDSGTGQTWQLPPITFLQEVTGGVTPDAARDEYLRQLLERTLNEFGVEAKITEVNRGPVVTSFEVLPAPGVRVEKIAGLSNNLALALKAESIRVQAPIPGKGVVGIEVPNSKTSVVFARQIIGGPEWERSKDWRKGKIALPLCLGVDVSGNTLVGDLADMPHLLIAGATGSGKSVCMNSLLAGLLMSRTPDQLRLILVDPKIVEFTAYRDLPHLVVPVITDPKKVGLGLRWAITEMEKRYKLFAKVGVRNIRGYNTRVVAKQGDLFGVEDENKDKHPETLPYIVVVIDELADLMMVAQAEIENYIARLAQLSRAVGIHMILATQRPSVNVITGTIKANFPSRIAFQVAQKTDSRTILDAIGADKLLGKGDMLFLAPSSAKLQRAQGAWTSDEEINKIVDFIKAQGTPDYENKVTEKLTNPAPELPDQDEDDDLIEQAIEVIRQTRRASTSSLQRRLRIGYNRAARLMDQLEEKGVIGPPQGSEPREILIDLDGEVPQNDTEMDLNPEGDG
jgi:S-DNA-T family DNA segregation ATPase FtsK/SpoIIIE